MKGKHSKEAQEFWMTLDCDLREAILNSVWCGSCKTSVTICDYSVTVVKELLVLKGFCSICGHKASRTVECYNEDRDCF